MVLPAATGEGWLVPPLATTPWAAAAVCDGSGAPSVLADATALAEAESLARAGAELCPNEIAVHRAGVHIAIKTLFMRFISPFLRVAP